MRSGHCSGSAGRRWPRRMTGCTPVHGNIQNAAPKTRRASSELGYRQPPPNLVLLGVNRTSMVQRRIILISHYSTWLSKLFLSLEYKRFTGINVISYSMNKEV